MSHHDSVDEQKDVKDTAVISQTMEIESIEYGSQVGKHAGNDAHGSHPATETTLICGNEVVLIPQPTRDPRDPLNMPEWRKWATLAVLGLFSILSVLLSSGMGAFTGLMFKEYHGDPRVNDLLVYPTLFMGLGNVVGIPASIAIGRRPVLIFSSLLLAFTSLGCGLSQSFNSHFGVRAVMALAAGQSEALCPMVVQEINFLHVRGNRMAVFSGMQTIGFSVMMIATGHITTNLGWRWWYHIAAIISIVVAILCILIVPESRYERQDAIIPSEDINASVPIFYTDKRKPVLDTDTFGESSYASTLRIFGGRAQWTEAVRCLGSAVQVLLYPNIFWLVLMNSLSLSAYIVMTTEYAGALGSAPYRFSYDAIGYVMAAQLITALIFVPLQGLGGDWLVKKLAKRNKGQTRPEHRLIPLIMPVGLAVAACIIFGQTLADPFSWHWTGIAIPMNAIYFTFTAVILGSYTYSIDAYPERAGAILLLYCSSRGIVSFGVSLSTVNFLEKAGPRGAFNVLAILFGVVSAFGIPLYFFGPAVRRFTARY
ncbi:related to synaptic vesicle transporter SVOP and related transporters (major facilitator superfamily) [Ustilago trichophora]|uniref:Related to synaptic vesicle transporter SVOP and related transporters (Major facilitator superfamily) n=1 Tax=Ustilago trichophora TaxID=86804 RepID=A0A5C3E4Y5_9BASI|nr:related to synaptic vesicle transporter SVOP and related transporters (major facilitator superfamily) [Ustilago trichophora]